MKELLLEQLREYGVEPSSVEIHMGNPILVVIQDYQLPNGFKISSSPLLLKIPITYPQGKPDMFWLATEAMPIHGKLPFSPRTESLLGKSWLRYSWHPAKWNPSQDNLATFLGFIESGLRKVA